MRNDIINKLSTYARDNEAIDSIFCLKNENYDSLIKIYTIVNEVIIGKLEEELRDLFDDVILVNRFKDEFVFDKSKYPFTSISIYTKDNIKITESIIASDNAQDFIMTLPKDIEFIYNKPGFERLQSNENFSYQRPSEYEVTNNIKNFFANAIEVSLYVDQKDEIAASIKMDQLRLNLLNMIDFYIKEKYSYQMDKGADGQNLKSTLEIDIRQDFLLTYHYEDFMDIYNSLFKACVLFRKLAMGICQSLSYDYPREIDVESMKLLRSNYKKIESFLS